MKTIASQYKSHSGRISSRAVANESIGTSSHQQSQAAAKPRVGRKVIQTKIKSPFEKGKFLPSPIHNIQNQIDQYNSIGGWRFTFPFEERQQALIQLGRIERMVYQWFTENTSFDLQSDPIAVKMKFLMNAIQMERRELVDLSLKNEDEIPPVANWKDLDIDTQGQLKRIWKHLQTQGNIKIQGDRNFFIQVMTDFSRLLETSMGRQLVEGIAITNQGLVIKPSPKSKPKFVARPTDSDNEAFREVNPHEFDISQFITVDLTQLSEKRALNLLQDLRVKNKGSSGIKVISATGVRYFAFGSGSGSELPVPEDAVDAMENNASRMADAVGTEVISPTFIILGHELGHVLRSAQGMSAVSEGSKLIGHGFPSGKDFDRPEEFFNIEGVENELREQSGMALRAGHGNLYSYWGVTIMNQLELFGKKILELEKNCKKEATPLLEEQEKLRMKMVEQVQILLTGQGSIKELIDGLTQLKKALNGIKSKFELPEKVEEMPSLSLSSGEQMVEKEKESVKKELIESSLDPISPVSIQIYSWEEVRKYIIEEDVTKVYEGKIGTKVTGLDGHTYILNAANGDGQFTLDSM